MLVDRDERMPEAADPERVALPDLSEHRPGCGDELVGVELRRVGEVRRARLRDAVLVVGDGADRRRADVERDDPEPAQAAASSGSNGSSTRKHVPSPARDVTTIVPPCASTIAREITSPSPVPGNRLLGRDRRAEEALEQTILLGLRDPDARVGNLQHGVVAVHERAHRDRSAGGRELQRIREQVAHELHEPVVVAEHRRYLLEVGLEHDLARACKRDGALDELACHARRGVTSREVQLQAARVEPRDEEQVADQALEPLGASVDDREKLRLLLRQLTRLAVSDHLEEAHHRGQRGPQLVRHGGDEVVLQPVELALLRHLAQRPDAAHEPAAIVVHRRREPLEHTTADCVLELVEGRPRRGSARSRSIAARYRSRSLMRCSTESSRSTTGPS